MAAGLIALWLRRRGYVEISGALINLAGIIIWWAAVGHEVDRVGLASCVAGQLLQTNVICLAIGSVVWSLLESCRDCVAAGAFCRVCAGALARRQCRQQNHFARVAAQLGVCLLGLLVACCVADELLQFRHVGTAAAGLDCPGFHCGGNGGLLGQIGRPGSSLPAMYGLGLSAVGMA